MSVSHAHKPFKAVQIQKAQQNVMHDYLMITSEQRNKFRQTRCSYGDLISLISHVDLVSN